MEVQQHTKPPASKIAPEKSGGGSPEFPNKLISWEDQLLARLQVRVDSATARMDEWSGRWDENQPDDLYEKFLVPATVKGYEVLLRTTETVYSFLRKSTITKQTQERKSFAGNEDYIIQQLLHQFEIGSWSMKPPTPGRYAKFMRRVTAAYCRELLKVSPKLKDQFYQTAPNRLARKLLNETVLAMKKGNLQAIDPEFANTLGGALLHPTDQTPILLDQFVNHPPLKPEQPVENI